MMDPIQVLESSGSYSDTSNLDLECLEQVNVSKLKDSLLKVRINLLFIFCFAFCIVCLAMFFSTLYICISGSIVSIFNEDMSSHYTS